MTNIGSLLNGKSVGKDTTRNAGFQATPEEATRSLLWRYTHEIPRVVLEPCCGDGKMSRVLAETRTVISSDLVYRGFGAPFIDFLEYPFDRLEIDRFAIITNPPFYLADDMIRKACSSRAVFVAMFLPQRYWNTKRAYALWKDHPPQGVHPLTYRPDFSGQGSPTMDCMWCVWSPFVRQNFEPLPRCAT